MKKSKNIRLTLLALFSLAAIGSFLGGCKGNGLHPTDPARELTTSGALEEDLEVQLAALFESKCASCHNAGDGTNTGLILTSDQWLQTSVEVASFEVANLFRVEPGNKENSYLFQKITQDVPAVGSRMPQGLNPLSEAEIAKIGEWIDGLEGTGQVIVVECSAADSLDASNIACCDTTRIDAECYVCTDADKANRDFAECFQCSAADSVNPDDLQCYVCTEADLLNPLVKGGQCACTDLQKQDPTDTVCYEPPVSFANDIQPIFTEKCILCHADGVGTGFLQTGGDETAMILEEGLAYASLLNYPTFNYGDGAGAPAARVTASDTAASFLWWKVSREDDFLLDNDWGNRMPQFGEALEAGELELIAKWIMQGALNN